MLRTMPIGLRHASAGDTSKQTPWRAFLNKNKPESMDPGAVIEALRAGATQFGFPTL